MKKNKLKKVDFIWVNRDFQAFEWFIELLGQIELQQLNSAQEGERFIDIHLYMTSSKELQWVKPQESPSFNMEGQLIQSDMDDFALKLEPGRPNLDQVYLAFFMKL